MAKVKSMSAKKSTHHSLLPYIVWSLSCVFYFYECLLQVSPGVMSNELMRDFNVTSQTLGVLSGIYFYSYAAMQLPAGVLMDYFGPRRLLTLATVLCAVSTIAFGYTDNFLAACIARLMIGLGSAFAVVGALKLSTNWFSANRFAMLTGLMVTIGMLGAIGGEAPLALLIDNCGWRETMIIMGFVGIAIAVLIFLVVRDAPETSLAPVPVATEEEPILASLLALVKNRQLWCVAVYGGLMYLATPVFCGLWGVPFLMNKMGLAKAVAANYISLIFIGWAVAGPLWGIFSNRIGRRKPPMYIGSVVAFITCMLFLYAPLESGFISQLMLFLFGCFSAGFLPAFAVAKELCSKKYVATGLSFMNMMNMVGIAVIQPVIGMILDHMWSGKLVNEVRVYPIDAYYLALAVLPAGILISLIILPFIKETYCHNLEDLPLNLHKKKR